MSEQVERVYAVEGMSCGHCVAAVTASVGAVAGVGAVDVDLAAGRVTVRGAGFADGAVVEAVEEAGYEGRVL